MMTATRAEEKQDTNFSLERLERLLKTGTKVEWRHDVDFDPDAALQMAHLEHKHGVQSTYYVMCQSESYNALAPNVMQTFKTIIGYGHQLGIHVDLRLGRSAKVQSSVMRKACERDARIFRAAGYEMTRRVSFHAPPLDVLWRDVRGFEHALGPQWEGRYVADSRGVFRQSPEDALKRGGAVTLNLHPEWWFWPLSVAEYSRKIEAEKP